MTDEEHAFAGMSPQRSVKLGRPFRGETEFWIGRCLAKLAASRGTSAIPKGHVGGGAAGPEPASVRTRAFGEFVERASAIVAGREFVGAPSRVETMPEWFDEARSQPLQWPRVGDVCSWVPAIELVSERPGLVPARLAFLQWGDNSEGSQFARPDATGLAAHTSDSDAIRRGLLEVLERDAAILSWTLSDWPIRLIDLTSVSTEAKSMADELGFSVSAFEIGRSTLPPVALAIASMREGGGTTVGTKCAFELGDAVNGAIAESLALQDAVTKMAARPTRLASPRTSLDHVLHAYDRGVEVRSWYEDRAIRADDRLLSGWTSASIAATATTAFGAPVYCVRLLPKATGHSNWRVWRVIAPGAASPAKVRHIGAPNMHRRDEAIDRMPSATRDSRRRPDPFG